MKIVLFGGWGQLGTDLTHVAQTRHEIIRPTHSDADIADATKVSSVLSTYQPDAVINAAAFHKVEACEEAPEHAFTVNSLGAFYVATASRAVGARSIFISTDYVFGGSRMKGYEEDAPPGPINVYGTSKAAGEQLVTIGDPDSLIVRGSGMFGHAGSSGKGGNFVETMLRKAENNESISVVDDQVFAPTATHDLAERILLLLERNVPPGIYHATNAGCCSWYRFARKIFELSRLDVSLTPRPTVDAGVRRPAYSVLLDTKTPALTLPPMRSWEAALEWYLRGRGSDSGPRATRPAYVH